jgi:hypothetical protein
MAALHGPKGSSLVANIFALLGCLALLLTLSGNFLSGQRTAFSGEGELWQGGMALLIDATFAALCLWIGWLVSRKSYTAATAFGLIAVIFGAASAWSLVGFSLSESTNKSRTMALNQQSQATVDQVNYEAKLQAWNAYTDTLDASILAKGGSPTDKASLLAARKEAASATPELKAPKIESALTDAQAQVTAELAKRAGTAIKEEDVQLARAILISVLAVLAKAICFGIAGYRPPEEDSTLRSERKVAPVAAEAIPPSPEPPKVIDINPPRSNTPRISGRAPLKVYANSAKARQFAEATEERERIVNRFFDEMVVAQPGNQIQAADLYAAFSDWTRDVNEQRVGGNAFGRVLTKRGTKKHLGAVANYYLDIAVREVPSTYDAPPTLSNVTVMPLSDKRKLA